MFYVEVIRHTPYEESLWYDFDDLADAIAFAQREYNMYGVEDVKVYYNDEVVGW